MKIRNNLQFPTEYHSSLTFKVLVFLIALPCNCNIIWNNAVSVHSIPFYTACFITLCHFLFFFYFSPNLSRNSSSKCFSSFFSPDQMILFFLLLFFCGGFFVGMHDIYPTTRLFSWYWRNILLSIYHNLWNCSMSMEPIIQSQPTYID